jgi:hypothetical protein
MTGIKLEISRDFWHIGSRCADPLALVPRRFRLKTIPHRHHAAGKRRIRLRLDRPVTSPSPEPVPTAANIHYEAAAKTRGIACGGIGAIHLVARKLGLPQAIDEDLHLLKIHLPYHESDHVPNFASCGAERRRARSRDGDVPVHCGDSRNEASGG